MPLPEEPARTQARELWELSQSKHLETCVLQHQPECQHFSREVFSCTGESHRQMSLVGYRPRGGKESDTTERLHFTFITFIPEYFIF